MDWEVKFVAMILILVVGTMGIAAYLEIFGFEPPNIDGNLYFPDQSSFYLPTVTGENISKYKNACTELDLSTITNNSEPPYNQKFKFKGELIGVFQNTDNVADIQLKTSHLTLYPYVLVSYSNKINYTIGDQLEIYGEYNGMAVYENNEFVPSFKASYIEKV